ncbi:hypothetical protein [Bradyrhizobium sp. CCBAU 65884]|uniref:hypothetical protein n=1 Tax=Bradyrhizobium sp. CCBAU 65884 TaxID=722477 RepID=UPI0023050B7C|nr:hypothetical protein [Bradyrhizobium sp. CCBAU 65884]
MPRNILTERRLGPQCPADDPLSDRVGDALSDCGILSIHRDHLSRGGTTPEEPDTRVRAGFLQLLLGFRGVFASH